MESRRQIRWDEVIVYHGHLTTSRPVKALPGLVVIGLSNLVLIASSQQDSYPPTQVGSTQTETLQPVKCLFDYLLSLNYLLSIIDLCFELSSGTKSVSHLIIYHFHYFILLFMKYDRELTPTDDECKAKSKNEET